MPLDLHVLSLPLAFILSQDQTLLCIFLFLSLTPDTFNSLSESTLSIFFVSRYLLVLPVSVFSKIFITAPNRRGLQRYDKNLNLQKNICIIFKKLAFKELLLPPFGKAGAKVAIIFFFPNLFKNIIKFFSNTPDTNSGCL